VSREWLNTTSFTNFDGGRNLSGPKFDFSRRLVVFGNLTLLGWALMASLSLTLSNPLYACLLLLFTAAIIFLILRRLGCSSCYNCKSCTSGFGRLAGWFFGSRENKDLNNKTALVFVAVTYCLLIPIPLAMLSFSLVQEVTALKLLVLSCLLFVSIYSITTWLRRS